MKFVEKGALEQTPNDAPFQFILQCIFTWNFDFLCASRIVESLVTFDHV